MAKKRKAEGDGPPVYTFSLTRNGTQLYEYNLYDVVPPTAAVDCKKCKDLESALEVATLTMDKRNDTLKMARDSISELTDRFQEQYNTTEQVRLAGQVALDRLKESEKEREQLDAKMAAMTATLRLSSDQLAKAADNARQQEKKVVELESALKLAKLTIERMEKDNEQFIAIKVGAQAMKMESEIHRLQEELDKARIKSAADEKERVQLQLKLSDAMDVVGIAQDSLAVMNDRFRQLETEKQKLLVTLQVAQDKTNQLARAYRGARDPD